MRLFSTFAYDLPYLIQLYSVFQPSPFSHPPWSAPYHHHPPPPQDQAYYPQFHSEQQQHHHQYPPPPDVYSHPIPPWMSTMSRVAHDVAPAPQHRSVFGHTAEHEQIIDRHRPFHRHVDHRTDGVPARRLSSPRVGALPPLNGSPSLSAASVDRSSNSSAPPPATHPHPSPSPDQHQHYSRMHYQDEQQQLVDRYRGDPGHGSGYNMHQYSHPPPQRYSYYPSSGQAPPPPGHYAPQSPPPHGEAPRNSFPQSISAGLPAQNFQVVHTDDAATKLSDRVRRRCFNCCTTETSTWRRSSLNPGKVVRDF